MKVHKNIAVSLNYQFSQYALKTPLYTDDLINNNKINSEYSTATIYKHETMDDYEFKNLVL